MFCYAECDQFCQVTGIVDTPKLFLRHISHFTRIDISIAIKNNHPSSTVATSRMTDIGELIRNDIPEFYTDVVFLNFVAFLNQLN